jgi:putative DNA primase/helicase
MKNRDFETRVQSAEGEALSQFQEAMAQEGIVCKEPLTADGKLHRFHVHGDKPGKRNGWYIVFRDGLTAGAFGCWKRGISQTWYAKDTRTLSAREKIALKTQLKQAEALRQKEQEAQYKEAAERAQRLWENAQTCLSHPYLTAKKVKPYGLRIDRRRLLIPLRNTKGEIQTLQFIHDDGKKMFLPGGRKKGGFFAIPGNCETLLLCEGYATGASLYDVYKKPVIVAFDAGNLLSVGQAIRAKHPRAKIINCADNDENTPGNPGLTKAREAAKIIGAKVVYPPICGDFNDWYTGGHDV